MDSTSATDSPLSLQQGISTLTQAARDGSRQHGEIETGSVPSAELGHASQVASGLSFVYCQYA
jgi:hypothetical protein